MHAYIKSSRFTLQISYNSDCQLYTSIKWMFLKEHIELGFLVKGSIGNNNKQQLILFYSARHVLRSSHVLNPLVLVTRLGKQVLLLFPFYRRGRRCEGRWIHLPELTQLEALTQQIQISRPDLFSNPSIIQLEGQVHLGISSVFCIQNVQGEVATYPHVCTIPFLLPISVSDMVDSSITLAMNRRVLLGCSLSCIRISIDSTLLTSLHPCPSVSHTSAAMGEALSSLPPRLL